MGYTVKISNKILGNLLTHTIIIINQGTVLCYSSASVVTTKIYSLHIMFFILYKSLDSL